MAIGSLLQEATVSIVAFSGYIWLFQAFHNMREKYRDEDGKGRQPGACALILVSGACLQMRLPKTAGHVV